MGAVGHQLQRLQSQPAGLSLHNPLGVRTPSSAPLGGSLYGVDAVA
jgi:hypothetical protein